MVTEVPVFVSFSHDYVHFFSFYLAHLLVVAFIEYPKSISPQQWGFEPLKECPFSNLRVKFTDFLMATAAGKVEGEKVPGKIATPFEKTKVAAYTLGAISPCMRLFSFISKEIQAILDPSEGSHVYKKWIDTYCSEEFEVH